MNPLPTFPQKFIADFFEPTRREMEPTGANRETILDTANQKASEKLGFRVDLSLRTVYRHLREV